MRRFVAALALALALTGCAGDDTTGTDRVEWPKVAEPVGATTLSWVDDDAVLGETEDADGAWSYFACTVPAGDCSDVDGSRWEEGTPARVYPVNRPVYSSSQCCESD